MTTVGGAISGYWAMGSTCDAIRPAIVMMIEMTPAKMGRPMKNSENDMTAGRYFGGAAGAAGAAVGASVTGAQSRQDRPVGSDPVAGAHGHRLRLSVRIDDEDERRLLGLHDGRLRD